MRLAAVRPRLPLVVAVVAATAIAFPLGVLASHQFSDVPNSNPYHADIAALAGSGVTTGCGGGQYCPSDYVTREQMAAFMNRLGALGAGKTPVVNAAKVDGIDEVLAAGDIVMSIAPEWLASGNSPVTFIYYGGGTRVSSAGAGIRTIHEGLTSPESIGGRAYGVAAAEVCWLGSTGTTITHAYIHRTHGTATTVVISDPTDRPLTSTDCATFTTAGIDESEGPATITLDIDFDAGAFVEFTDVRVTWEPVPAP